MIVCMFVCMHVCITSDSENKIQQDVINEWLYSNRNLYSEMFRLEISPHRRDFPPLLSRDLSQFLQGNDRMAN